MFAVAIICRDYDRDLFITKANGIMPQLSSQPFLKKCRDIWCCRNTQAVA